MYWASGGGADGRPGTASSAAHGSSGANTSSAARGGGARPAALRLRRELRDEARGVERIAERAMRRDTAERALGERAEPQVGRVGPREREQVLRVEEARARERRRDETGQEITLELRVVRDDRAPRERFEQRRGNGVDPRRVGEVGFGESRQRGDRAWHASARANPRFEHAQAHLMAFARVSLAARNLQIDEHRADLDRLRRALLGQARGLEVDDRDRADGREKRHERRELEPDRAGRDLAHLRRRSHLL
jgi:hypothetical protein